MSYYVTTLTVTGSEADVKAFAEAVCRIMPLPLAVRPCQGAFPLALAS